MFDVLDVHSIYDTKEATEDNLHVGRFESTLQI